MYSLNIIKRIIVTKPIENIKWNTKNMYLTYNKSEMGQQIHKDKKEKNGKYIAM